MEFIARPYYERLIRGAAGEVLQREFAALMELLGSSPDLASVPPSYWLTFEGRMLAALQPYMEAAFSQAFVIQAQGLPGSLRFNNAWMLPNEQAAAWASQHAATMVKGITPWRRERIGQYIASYYRDQWSLGQLQARIGTLYSPKRAAAIASTEVTRASVQGERALVKQVKKANPRVRPVPVWITNLDELVCPFCAPLNGRPLEFAGRLYPPAHTRCRCWVNYEFLGPKALTGARLGAVVF